MSNEHPWCRDLARDTAIRAAEDAAASERPPLPEWRDFPGELAALRAETAALVAKVEAIRARRSVQITEGETLANVRNDQGVRPMPKGAPPSLRPVTESRSPAPGTEFPQQADFPAAEKAAQQESGLRTERVTLELSLLPECPPITEWPWDKLPLNYSLRLLPGESARVVPSDEADAEVERLRAEVASLRADNDKLARDKEFLVDRLRPLNEAIPPMFDSNGDRLPALGALHELIRERDAALASVGSVKMERDGAKRRCAELEDRVDELEAKQADAEPVADLWGVLYVHRDTISDLSVRETKAEALRLLENSGGIGTVVPIYRAPPPPRGWLSQREREALTRAMWSGSEMDADADCVAELLSRNSPPRVRLPKFPYIEQEWREALAAAGVEVGE